MLNKKRNLAVIGITFFLIIFSVTFVFNARNNEVDLAYKHNLSQLQQKAKENYYQGDYQQSIQVYQEILAGNKQHISVRKNLAAVYETINDYQAAIEQYQKIISLRPQEYSVYYDLGELYYNLGKYQKALPNLQKAVGHPQDSEVLKSAYLYLTQIYKERTEYNLALDAVDRALEIDPNSALAYYYLGQIRDSLGKFEAAISAYQQVLKKDGSFENAHLNLAEDYFELKKYQQAVKKYKKALNKDIGVELAQKRLETLKELKPQLFATPEEKEQKEEQERKKILEKEVTFAEIKPVPGKEEIPKLKVGLAENRKYLAFRVGSEFLIKSKRTKKALFTGAAKVPWP